MSKFKKYTQAEFSEIIERNHGKEFVEGILSTVSKWTERGDGAAVYENHDLGHPDQGLCKIVSYGSEKAQLEVTVPFDTLPDIGSAINWRYQLVGVFGGPAAVEAHRSTPGGPHIRHNSTVE